MRLEGSCSCGAVRFSLEAYAPVPYQRCYCSICRKTAGSGGFAINLGAHAGTLQVDGAEHIGVFRAVIDGETSPAERRFCRRCGTALWIHDPDWPELVHPFAGAVDTPLPEPPQRVHMMLASRAPWVQPEIRHNDHTFAAYPDQSLEGWHREFGLFEE